MSVSSKHLLQQGPVLAAMGQTALSALWQQINKPPQKQQAVQTPGPEFSATIPPRSRDLVRDYIRFVGGDPSAYKKIVPPHLFPQWGFALSFKTLGGLSYPLTKVLNGGCRLEINAPLPAGKSLQASARLESLDDNGRRAVLHQRICTGTRENPEAVVGHMYAIVPLGDKKKSKGNGKPKKEKARVPQDAKELKFWKLGAHAGRDFALLTGDFNPVHWIAPYAKAFGFRNTILHGFATMALAYEGLNRSIFAGDIHRIKTLDVKFTRPLVLPAKVGLYMLDDQIFVGDAPGGPAYLVGKVETRA
jgi:acyl dehydratase